MAQAESASKSRAASGKSTLLAIIAGRKAGFPAEESGEMAGVGAADILTASAAILVCVTVHDATHRLAISSMAGRGRIEHMTEITAAHLGDPLRRETLFQHLFHNGAIESDLLVRTDAVRPLADALSPAARDTAGAAGRRVTLTAIKASIEPCTA